MRWPRPQMAARLRALIVQTLLLAAVLGPQSGWSQPAAPATPTSLSATLSAALAQRGLSPGHLAQPAVKAAQAARLFSRFMVRPDQAWTDVDELAQLNALRPLPGEVLRTLRTHVGHSPEDADQPPATAHVASTGAPATVPPHIPPPFARVLQNTLNALTLAEAWRQHALRRLPAHVSASALLTSALPGSSTSTEAGDHHWSHLAPLVDSAALHTGARIALAATERLHAYVTRAAPLPAVHWRTETPLGTVLVDTTGAHNHHVLEHPLLLLDVGGNDHYELGGHLAAPRPGIRVLLDHGGDDHYLARAPGAGPSSAVLGYGILWDTAGDDQHHGGWLAQGAALLGVAVHIDDAGHNLLQASGLAQGYALGGTALLLGSPGHDLYQAQTLAQASAGPLGAALLLEPAGHDRYHLGNEVLLWPSSQLPGHNVSLGQGAGFGASQTQSQPEALEHLPGGVALLLDAQGDDHYRAQVFAQGSGLRQGTGLLLDQGGHNQFQAAWYAMGAAAHQGAGLLWTSGGGDDRYTVSHVTAMGAGHDQAVGMLVDAGGHDQFVLHDLGLGAAHDGGHGVLVRGGSQSRQASDVGAYLMTGPQCRGIGQSHGSPGGRAVWVDATAQHHCVGNPNTNINTR